MAAVEDDSDYASHFLDSMLEVEMTEEDAELDISKNDDPLDMDSRTLPPIPTFDLQSETLSYKDVYKASLMQPLHPSLPLVPTPENVPGMNSGPMLPMYPGEMLPSPTGPMVPKISSTTIQKVTSKLNAKPRVVLRDILPKGSLSPHKPPPPPSSFMEEVFKPQLANVFSIQDPKSNDLSEVTEEEMEYYKACFSDLFKIQQCRLHCTICDKHIGCGANAEKRASIHKMLKVLTCKPCHEFYGDGNFPMDQGDNCEIYCRWCGQGGALVCCSFCPRVFCKKCVKCNFGALFLKNIQKASDWACFCCAQKPLWPHRAVCRALMEYIAVRKTDGRGAHRDTSKCCGTLLGRKQMNRDKEKPNVPVPQTQLKINPLAKTPAPTPPTPPVKPLNKKEHALLKTSVQIRVSNSSKSPASLKTLKENPTSNVISKPLFTGNNIIRGLTTNTPAKTYTAIPPPQMIQTPVLHGETLITPPGSRKLATPKVPIPKLPNPAAAAPSPAVKVSFASQTPNVDVNKIPTAKIPQGIQSLIMRMTFPDNKVQLIRLLCDVHKCKTFKQFPMPAYKDIGKKGLVEEHLSDSFRVTKLLYDQLASLNDSINSMTKETQESVLNASVGKLHFIYKKSAELLKDLDVSLSEKYEEWKNKAVDAVDVIDLSEDEVGAKKEPGQRKKFLEKCQELVLSEDSDVEILDDVSVNQKKPENSVNSKQVSVNGNFQQKYMLRGTSIERLKNYQEDDSVDIQRKRARRTRKRTRTSENISGEETEGSVVDQSADETKLEEVGAEEDGNSEDSMKKRRRKLNDEKENPNDNKKSADDVKENSEDEKLEGYGNPTDEFENSVDEDERLIKDNIPVKGDNSSTEKKEDSVDKSKNTVNMNEDSVDRNEISVDDSKNFIDVDEDSVDTCEYLDNRNENSFEINEDSVDKNENPVGGSKNPVDISEDSVDRNENLFDGNENSVDGNKDVVDLNEDSVDRNENSVDRNENSVDGNENSTGGNENSTGGNENSVGGDENSVDGTKNSADGSQNPVDCYENSAENGMSVDED